MHLTLYFIIFNIYTQLKININRCEHNSAQQGYKLNSDTEYIGITRKLLIFLKKKEPNIF